MPVSVNHVKDDFVLIAVGSTNPIKYQASQRVLGEHYPHAQFVTIGVESGVAVQPWGDAETRRGAYNRAKSALNLAHADLGVGLEGGLQETEFGVMTCAWCVMVDRNGRIGVGGSACVQLPNEVATAVQAGIELGVAMDQWTGQQNTKHGLGAIGILTNGLLTRQEAYEPLIKLALSPFQRGQE